MTLFRWRCWLRAVWYAISNPPTLRGPFAGAFISGHEYHIEMPEGVTVTDEAHGYFRADVSIGRCVDCGVYNFGWKRA